MATQQLPRNQTLPTKKYNNNNKFKKKKKKTEIEGRRLWKKCIGRSRIYEKIWWKFRAWVRCHHMEMEVDDEEMATMGIFRVIMTTNR
jgi:hypothetical protein